MSGRRKQTPETRLKKAVKDTLKACGIYHFHLLQGLGCYPGLPDIQALWQGQTWHLEMKDPDKKPRKTKTDTEIAQEAHQAKCQEAGVPYLIIRSVDDLVKGMDLPLML